MSRVRRSPAITLPAVLITLLACTAYILGGVTGSSEGLTLSLPNATRCADLIAGAEMEPGERELLRASAPRLAYVTTVHHEARCAAALVLLQSLADAGSVVPHRLVLTLPGRLSAACAASIAALGGTVREIVAPTQPSGAPPPPRQLPLYLLAAAWGLAPHGHVPYSNRTDTLYGRAGPDEQRFGYDRLVLLASDTLVLRPLDHLFLCCNGCNTNSVGAGIGTPAAGTILSNSAGAVETEGGGAGGATPQNSTTSAAGTGGGGGGGFSDSSGCACGVEDPGEPGSLLPGLLALRPDPGVAGRGMAALAADWGAGAEESGGAQAFLSRLLPGWGRHPAQRLPASYNFVPRHNTMGGGGGSGGWGWGSWGGEAAAPQGASSASSGGGGSDALGGGGPGSSITSLDAAPHVVHWHGPVKPWSFATRPRPAWPAAFDPHAAWLWVRAKDRVDARLGGAASASASAGRPHCSAARPAQSPLTAKFSLMINTLHNEAAALQLARYYAAAPSLAATFIVWHDPAAAPSGAAWQGPGPPPVLLRQTTDTLNNRFNPVPDLPTELVLTLDDDTWVEDMADVELAFQVARQQPHRLVGFYLRAHALLPAEGAGGGALRGGGAAGLRIAYVSKGDFRVYSIVLTKFMFLHVDYMFMYSCLLPPAALDYVTANRNCEDILINWMVSGFTGLPPLAVLPSRRVFDAGSLPGGAANVSRLMHQAGHYDRRAACMADFAALLGGGVRLRLGGQTARRLPVPPETPAGA